MKRNLFNQFIIGVLIAIMIINCSISSFSQSSVSNFVDVSEKAWYASSVDYVTEKRIMVGTSATKFSPDMQFTRAMTVLVLARLSGDDLTKYTTTDFPDVPEGEWYTSAVAWAVNRGIARGDGTKFNPDQIVTREQLALMITQFAEKYEVINLYPARDEDLNVFNDADKVSDWAKYGVEWAVYNGIISGKGNNTLDPKGGATRAEAAKIFYYLDFMNDSLVLPPDTTDFDKVTFTESDQTRIVCWGDSMSQGYPTEFRKTYRVPTISFSAGGDTAEHMAMKQGALALYAAPFTIPAEAEPALLTVLDYKFEKVVSLADLGGNGLTPVYINGIKGALYYRSEGDCFYFERETAGEEIRLDRPVRIVTKAMTDLRTEDVNIIYSVSVSPGVRGDVDALVEIQRSMIDYAKNGKYVIIGYAGFSSKAGRISVNSALAEEYGEHFLDFGEYLVTDGFKDAGIEPTEEDLKNIEEGRIPESFRSDEIHGNYIFDQLLAQQLYYKLIELNYIDPVV